MPSILTMPSLAVVFLSLWMYAPITNVANLRTIANSKATDREVQAAIDGLLFVTEPAGFWAAIGNDPRYSDAHRTRCVHELFDRHVHPGMSLAELHGVLEGAKWLREDRVYHVFHGAGFVPVRGSFLSDSFFALHVLCHDGAQAIYISIEGEMRSADLIESLQAKEVAAKFRGRKIIGVCAWPIKRKGATLP